MYLKGVIKYAYALEAAFDDIFSQWQSVCEIVGKRLQGKFRGIHDLSQFSLDHNVQI